MLLQLAGTPLLAIANLCFGSQKTIACLDKNSSILWRHHISADYLHASKSRICSVADDIKMWALDGQFVCQTKIEGTARGFVGKFLVSVSNVG